MVTTIGNNRMWATRQFHWEIRRGFTISNYSSNEFSRFLEIVKEDEAEYERKLTDLELDHFFSDLYTNGCLKALNLRLAFYKTAYPPSSYRRTSENFTMRGNPNAKIGAFVRSDEPEIIWLNDGIVFAIEDAAHTLLAIESEPLGISLEKAHVLPLRLMTQGHQDSFSDYTDIISKERLENISIPPFGYIPQIVLSSFFCLSSSLSRQIFAENISTISLMWVVSHEDAHKYSGHLKHFQNLGVSDQDLLFSELISTVTDNSSVISRKSSELEADTCATMRAVDYCFNSDFLQIITDSIPSDAMNGIWEGRRRSQGLHIKQRLFLLRLISLGSILPLIIFECSLANSSVTNSDCYPSFVVRSLNIIFVTASRAMDVSMSHTMSLVGQFNIREFNEFFSCAISDFKLAYNILIKSQNSQVFENKVELELSNVSAVASGLFCAFLGAHGQSHLLGLTKKMQSDDFGAEGQLIVELIRERYQMHLSSLETFADAKKEVNTSRTEKVDEDIQFITRLINIAKETFAFV